MTDHRELLEKLNTKKAWLVQLTHQTKTIILFNESSLESLKNIEEQIKQIEIEIKELSKNVY